MNDLPGTQFSAVNDPSIDLRGPLPASGTDASPPLPQLRALTSVRFFAAVHVALFHLVQPRSLWGPLENVMTAGYTAVSFFFLLSGFILTYSHSQNAARTRQAPLDFWVKRFARIYPVYLLALLFAFVVHPLQLVSRDRIPGITLNLLMLQSWVVQLLYYFNIPAWSLSVEAFFYLVFPFVLLRMRPRTAVSCVAAFTLFWLAAMTAPALCVWHSPGIYLHGAWIGQSHLLLTAVSRLPILALPEFLAGISLGWFHLCFRPSRRAAVALTLAGAAGIGVVWIASPAIPSLMLNNGLLLPCSAMLILGLAQDHALSRLLSGKTLVLLGNASYSLYLFHYLVGEFTRRRLGFTTSLLSGCVQLLITIAIAVMLYIAVERPARRWLLQRWSTRATHAL